MSTKPMTRQAWLDYLKKAVDEFDWEAAGQKREWVGLTDDEVKAYYDWADFQVGCGRQTLFNMVRAIEAKLKEKNK